jgi:hypothetical protein
MQFDLREIIEIPRVELDRTHRLIYAQCDTFQPRTVAYLLFSVFRELTGGAVINEIQSTSDEMGSKNIYIHLEQNLYFLKMQYGQSLGDSWQSVNVDGCERSVFLPPGISFNFDLNIVGSGFMSIDITGIGEAEALAITAILCRCFRSVEPKGARERRFVKELDAKNSRATEDLPVTSDDMAPKKNPAVSGSEPGTTTFIWPRFDGPVEITADRTWTALFESYDQRNEACYYVVSLHENGKISGQIMACVDVGWAGDDWTEPSFASHIKSNIHSVVCTGKSNTN